MVSGGDKRKAETSIGGLLAEGHHPVFIDQPGQIYGVAQEVRISWKVHYSSKLDLSTHPKETVEIVILICSQYTLYSLLLNEVDEGFV